MSAPSHVIEDQSEVIAFLADPRTHGGAAVERIDTHGAVVVLAGERAYKLKRAVRFPYMDFSTLALRRRACEAELELNRRTAPELYLAAEPVVRTRAGALAIGGEGETLDWVVVMRRFDQEALLDRRAARGALDQRIMTDLADAILRFHAAAEPRPEQGGAEGIARVVAGNDRGLREAGADVLDPAKTERLRQRSDAALERVGPLLEARRTAGLVRHCHGDLHLRNICLIEGRPTLFDAIEFNDQIACIDVLYDLAFLLMDLDHRGLGGLGNLVFNRYLSEGARRDGLGDLAGLAALPLFLSCRAGVRAQVGAAGAAAQPDQDRAARLIAEARDYLDLALRYLDPPGPRLVAVGGLSGTGKSTLARAIAPLLQPTPGAVLLRSDVIRKHLLGRDPLARLGPEGYTAELTARVYDTMRERARAALAAGHSVVADAVHGRADERAAIAAVARELKAPFDGLWLEAPPGVLEARVAARAVDASDATVEVLRQQLSYEIGAIDWQRIDVSGTPETALARARALLMPGSAPAAGRV
jgi:aminoglycoside phosphotransferase family enzyme/predicted kinase